MSKPKKPKSFDDLLDETTQYSNKWAVGTSGRAVGPSSLTILDLLKTSSINNQHPNNVVAPGPDIYGSQMLVELLGDLFVKAENLKAALGQAQTSPVLEDNIKAKKGIEKLIKKAQLIHKVIESISKDIDDFSVENSVDNTNQ